MENIFMINLKTYKPVILIINILKLKAIYKIETVMENWIENVGRNYGPY